MQELHCPLPQGSEAVYSRSSTAHCPEALRQCIAEVALPTAPRQWGSALRKAHCPLPPGSGAVYCRISCAHCPQAVRQCIAGDPLPPAPRQWGSALQTAHCPLPPGSEAVRCKRSTVHCPRQGGSVLQEMPDPLPQGREAVSGGSTTPHCPQAMRQCEARFPLPTVPRLPGSALHCPLPPAHNNSAAGHTQCSVVPSTKQCGTTQKAMVVQRGTQGAVGK